MNKKFLGQTIWFWLIVAGVFVVTQAIFYFGDKEVAVFSMIGGAFAKRIIIAAGVMAIVSLGLNLIYGFNGQFSLGQWGFYAIGAYAAADVTWRWNNQDASGLVFILLVVGLLAAAYGLTGRLIRRKLNSLDELSCFTLYLIGTFVAVGLALGLTAGLKGPVGMVLGLLPPAASTQVVFVIASLSAGGLAAALSYLFGQPVLKLGGDYFGIATLGLTLVVFVLANNADQVFPEMKGSRGMVGIPTVTTWFWVYVFLVLVILAVRNLLDSSYGRAIVSVREDEVAARAMGIDTTQFKTLSFVIGSFLAGLAGSLYAHQEGFLHPTTFNFIKAFDPLIIIVFGGLGSITGTVVASFAWSLTLWYILPLVLPPDGMQWRYVIYPLALLLIMLLRQQGLLGGSEWGFLKPARWPRAHPPAQPTSHPAALSAAGKPTQETEAH